MSERFYRRKKCPICNAVIELDDGISAMEIDEGCPNDRNHYRFMSNYFGNSISIMGKTFDLLNDGEKIEVWINEINEESEVEEEPMVKEKSWQEFRDSGMLWWINMILHTFGWAIIVEIDEFTNEISRVYPARVRFRGFGEKLNSAGYIKVSEYMSANAEKLAKEAKE